MREINVLNLGAGVQSTTLALMSSEGLIPRMDYAIFADTGEEPTDPGENVYDHLEWLRGQLPFPIIMANAGGRLGDHLKNGTNSTGHRFASIPAFTADWKGTVGKVRRQCTSEYKVAVVERVIRRQIVGVSPRQRMPKDVIVHQWFGISIDEVGRMLRAKERLKENPVRWSVSHYPLCEGVPVQGATWTRAECRAWLDARVPHRVPRSACTFCPYHDDHEWARIKRRDGADWRRVVEIDEALRRPGCVVNRKMDQKLYLHRSCVPIAEIDFEARIKAAALARAARKPLYEQTEMEMGGEREMAGECLGMCGS